MSYVLIKLSGGIVDDVSFYEDAALAVKELADLVKGMNPEDDDAAIYGPDGMIANAKTFLDEDDGLIEDAIRGICIPEKSEIPVYIIGNPSHRLGFMVTSFDDPLGHKDPAEALSDLGQLRKDYGNHLKLYRVVPVAGKIVYRKDLAAFNIDCGVEDLDHSLVEEHLMSR